MILTWWFLRYNTRMKKLIPLFLAALSAQAVSPKVATAAAASTLAVNALTIDKTARASWRAMKAAKKVAVKTVKAVTK